MLAKQYEYKKNFYTIKELAFLLDSSPQYLSQLLRNMTVQETIDYLNKDKILYKNQHYTIAEFAELVKETPKKLRRAIESNTFHTKYNISEDKIKLPIRPNLKGIAKLYPNLKQTCKDHDIDYQMVYSRLCLGMSLEEALTKPKKQKQEQLITINNKTYTVEELANITNKTYNTIYVTLIKRKSDPTKTLKKWGVQL